ncbi:MAG: ABC transporter ATP-binding protein [Xenococcaceae cyanobacterium MO_188.B32]|nr:ABC transporter ATP-binding protein [Xenococcaceae cyanobacterium MO_188.B32]
MSRRPKSLQESIPGIKQIIDRFWPQISQQGWLLTISVIGLFVEIFARLLVPWPMKLIFDRILIPGNTDSTLNLPILDELSPIMLLSVLAFGVVAVTALRSGAAYLSLVGMTLAATRIVTNIRAQLYAHLQRLSLAFHNQARSGDLITRVTNDTNKLRDVMIMAIIPLFVNIMTMLGMLGLMFWINTELTLISIVILPLFLLSTVRITKQIQKLSKKQRKREGAMASLAVETMGAIKVVKALSLEGMLENTFSTQNEKSLQEGLKTEQLSAGLKRTVEILVAIATALVLWRGVQLVLQQAITVGDLLVFTSYLKTAFKPTRQLAKQVGQIAKATASGERVIELLDTVPAIRDARGAIDAPPFRGAVRFNNVSFGYEVGKGILRNLSFEVQPGQRVALVGPSGGGKSTLVSLLLRLYDPWEGQIKIDRYDLRSYKIESLRRQITIVLQDSVLFGVSVRDNIAYGLLGATDKQIKAAAKLANAHDFIMNLPQGYDTILGERGATLSGGQRQRIAIARAAVRKAPIVILDEPTVGLDNENERSVSEALERLTQDCTTFLITHDLRTAVSADLILYIEKGEIIERGTHKELMQLGSRYATLYRLQSVVEGSRVRNSEFGVRS